MSALAAGWAMVIMVALMSSTLVHFAVPKRWSLARYMVTSFALLAIPNAFCGYALAHMGVHLLSGVTS